MIDTDKIPSGWHRMLIHSGVSDARINRMRPNELVDRVSESFMRHISTVTTLEGLRQMAIIYDIDLSPDGKMEMEKTAIGAYDKNN